jgi:RNA polymerase sigma-70 factor (ECF subfamily)
MARLRAGDEDAAAQIFHRFAGRLIALARSRLDGVVRKKIDPEDVVQSVYQSFFVRFADGQFALEGWDSLWAVLTVLTVRKCGHHVEHFRAARRDVYRELTPPPLSDDSHASWQAVAREPTPEEALVLTELVQELMRTLERRNRDIVSLGLQGNKPSQIAHQLGCTERTVQRVLHRVKQWLEKHHAGEGKRDLERNDSPS